MPPSGAAMPPTSILHLPSPSSLTPHTKHHLIYFIPGNPGYIGYYTSFLSHLASLLSPPSPTSTTATAFHILGHTLKGFDDSPATHQHGPFGLPAVIAAAHHSLSQQRIRVGPRAGQPFDAVILVGHSVGAYIALECVRLAQAAAASLPPPAAAILLFPTVTHIAQSPSGLRLSLLFRLLPQLPYVAQLAARALVWPLSEKVLSAVVGVVTGMEGGAVGVTAGFLRSGGGVWQALHLAREEMGGIAEDGWGVGIWGAGGEVEGVIEGVIEEVIEGEKEGEKEGVKEEEKESRVPKLVFYFGQDDHWVADHTRDALIAARGGGEGKAAPKMLIDLDGIPHGFCIRHSEQVAEKVKVWIDEIVEADL